MTNDQELLDGFIEIWHAGALDAIALLRSLDEADWEKPTDLPGWTVRAVAAHLAHLESELAGNPQQQVEVPEAPHIHGLMGQFTEMGPIARQGWSPGEIVDEFESSITARKAALEADPPTDASAPGPGFAGLIGWNWKTLLSNRPVDIWMHEQDIRRATDRPGGLNTPAAQHVATVFAASLPFVVGKKAKARPGETVVLEITGAQSLTLAAGVGEDGRGTALTGIPADPTARVGLEFENWIALAGGRGSGDVGRATVAGDPDLAARFLAALAVTP